jgi:hypothetical protein
MKYFSKITSQGNTPKNKLEENAKKLLPQREQLLIDELDLVQWIDDLKDRLDALSQYFKRCKPLTYHFDNSHIGNDKIFTCDGVFTIILYEVRNG